MYGMQVHRHSTFSTQGEAIVLSTVYSSILPGTSFALGSSEGKGRLAMGQKEKLSSFGKQHTYQLENNLKPKSSLGSAEPRAKHVWIREMILELRPFSAKASERVHELFSLRGPVSGH